MKTNRLFSFLCIIIAAVILVPAGAFADSASSGSTDGRTRLEMHAAWDNAYFTLSGRTGIAYVEQHDWKGQYTGLGEELHYGFFRVEIIGLTSDYRQEYIWAPSATAHTGEVISEPAPKFVLPYKDNYVVDVTPLKYDEAARYWRVDRIYMWRTPATWHVESTSNCSIGFVSIPGKVTVQVYMDGALKETYEETISHNGQRLNIPYYSGYTCSNPDHVITLVGFNGVCSPKTVMLFYTK